jgi:hypothetical protein
MIAMSIKFKFDKRITEEKFSEMKPVTRKNFYVVGSDSKGKSYIGDIPDATLVEARIKGRKWAKDNELKFEGVHSN